MSLLKGGRIMNSKKRMRLFFPEMQVLFKGDEKLNRAILRHSNDELIKFLAECCYNVLEGEVPLSPSRKKQLRKYRQLLRKIIDARVTVPQKRKIIIQSGNGFIAALIPAVIGAVASLLSSR